MKMEQVDLMKIPSQIQYFKSTRPSEAHAILAMNASFPSAITPHLLHKIWLNFKPEKFCLTEWSYELISDVLLSSLFTNTGGQIYRMPIDVRLSLQQELLDNYGQNHFHVLASFIEAYQQQNQTHLPFEAMKIALHWDSMMYLYPYKAARLLMDLIRQGKRREVEVNNIMNILNIYDIINLNYANSGKNLDPLSIAYRFVKGTQLYKNGDLDHALEYFESIEPYIHESPESENSFQVKISRIVLEKINFALESEELKKVHSFFKKKCKVYLRDGGNGGFIKLFTYLNGLFEKEKKLLHLQHELATIKSDLDILDNSKEEEYVQIRKRILINLFGIVEKSNTYKYLFKNEDKKNYIYLYGIENGKITEKIPNEMPDLTALKTAWTQMIAQGELETPLEESTNYCGQFMESRADEAVLLQGRYNSLMIENRKGTLTFENYSVERNRISDALFDFINSLEI